MKKMMAVLLLALGASPACGQDPAQLTQFQVGSYGDDARTVTCVAGPAGATFQQHVWAWVPEDLGLAYITLRFDFPENLDLHRRPDFNDLMSTWIIANYPDGTVEWNLIFRDCPAGWILVFTQEFALLDGEPSRIGILAAHSMIRDCPFVLNDVEVLNELSVNDPNCPPVPVAGATWGGLKSLYR